MKASYSWLKEYCTFDLPAHELAARLSHTGLNVDSFESRGDDWMLDVEVKSNRPDCLSHLGIAREIAAITGGEWHRPEFDLAEGGAAFEERARVEVTAPDLCPHYTARLITGLRVAPSPAWLQARLETCGVRPVNNVVDATNYVMLECGQPLHAFDLARLGGSTIIVRRSQPGETITIIDGTEVGLTGEECVIADDARPVAMAGVMGGFDSEISDATVDVLLESARFHPGNNRRTARRHGLSSESSYRYQRGVDPEITDWASRRACALIIELAGGTLLEGGADLRADSTCTPEVALRLARLELLLGIRVPADEVCRIFRCLGLDVLRSDEEALSVRVPSWRADLSREVDLIEEVARIHGYDRIGETTRMAVRPVSPDPLRSAQRRARRLLAGEGFTEVMSYTLVAPDELQLAQPWHDGEPIALRNPVSAERSHLRLTTMANLARTKCFNQAHGTPAVDLFELGNVHRPRPDAETPDELLALGMLTDRPDGLRVLKGVLANLVDELGVEAVIREKPGGRGPFEPGESVGLRLDDGLLGVAGIMAAEVAHSLNLHGRPALMEIDFRRLAALARLNKPYLATPSYPCTRRDLTVIVPDDVLWADVEGAVGQERPDVIERLDYVGEYRGEGIPAGHKGLTLTMTLRRADRTITAPDAEEASRAVLGTLERKLGARLR